ncbi:acyl carrier protein [Spirulina subsalsa FACHB-351]|uniref:Acyl carrier protein n=1 Tax=Spirulina subsalsa FACHB-351 TaxID=234711 RepID=A0ABT3L384_9CYAN|nr:acyl carrier protein [Spirulina subsalsa]MCW6035948.1 acyl carrier protein [Spirulina subsalsa FACHB-351]
MIESTAQTEKLIDLILQNIEEIGEEQQIEIPANLSTDTALFGKHGLFDSLGLVSLVVALEQRIEDEFELSISLADERAMSQKNSPYRTIESLANYAHSLMLEKQN